MVQFLNTAKAYSEIESIISRAESKLVLISPYIQIPRLLLERLNYASEKLGVNITMVCRKDNLKRDEFKASKIMFDAANIKYEAFVESIKEPILDPIITSVINKSPNKKESNKD